jgi:alanine dehydrogenase
MRIGIPRESKEGERRVAITPAEAASLAREGHAVAVEKGAGAAIGYPDDDYRAVRACIVGTEEAWESELIVKVKEIQPGEEARIRPGHAVFGFQHLIGEPEMTRRIAARGATAIAFEMVRNAAGEFSLLAPMSVIAGRMAVRVGAGILGRVPAKVLVLGAGHAGLQAAQSATDAGSQVVVLSRTARGIAQAASPQAIERHALDADLVIGAVFVPGAATPKLLPRDLVRRMKRGAVIVDISIDAGGVAETSRPTTHADPVYVEEGVVHYCIGNMPAADPRASAAALAAAALPFVRELGGKGIARALRESAALRAGVLLWKGRVTHAGIAAEAGLPYTPLSDTDLLPG